MSLVAEAEALVHELFRTDAGRSDPNPRLHRLRQIAPVHRSEGIHAWILTRYEDCRAALRDPRFAKRFAESMDAVADDWREHEVLAWFSRCMLQIDAPEHTRLRKKVTKAFTARRIAELRPRIEATVADLLDAATREGADLLGSLAFRLPITVIGDLMGIDRARLQEFRQPALDLTAGLEVRTSREAREAANEAVRFLEGFFAEEIAARRTAPGDDLFSALIVTDDPDPLSDQEIIDLGILLLIAGFETTTNVISGGLLALNEQPEQLAILRAGTDLGKAADEFLRQNASLRFVNRVMAEDVEIGGRVIPAGDTVFIMLAAANRDPAVYDEPDRLDFRREAPPHLTFGGGIHHCLGAALARLELDVLLEQLAARFSAVELTGERPAFRSTLAFRAVGTLPLRLRAAGDEPTGARPGRPADDAAWRDEQRRVMEEAPPELSPAELAARVSLLESEPLFSACRPSELVSLAATGYTLTFDAGDHLVTQGTHADDVYLLLEGEAEVLIDGEVVGHVGSEDLVGEAGVVTDSPRMASVVATGHVSTLVLSRARFRAVMEANPAARATMTAVTAARYPAARGAVAVATKG